MMFGFLLEAAHAQKGAPGIRVTVPFRFTIQRTTFSSGEYLIFSSRDRVWVQEASGRNIAVLLTGWLGGRVPERDGKVIFNCYFHQCFLSQLWIAGLEAGLEFPKPKRQVELASTIAGQQFAVLGKKPH
jgi:hypothetical protein